MDKLVIGLWGCFFGATAVVLTGAAAAFFRSLRRLALNAAATALASAIFAVAFLGGLPISDADTMTLVLAHLATLTSGVLTYQLLVTFGSLKLPSLRRLAVHVLLTLCLLVLLVGWQLRPLEFLTLSVWVACLLGVVALATCLRSAIRRKRQAWAAAFSVICVLVALGGFGWIALHRAQNYWNVHVVTALAATCYMATLAYLVWTRYAYLVELHDVLAHGPGYDPVTRMRSNAETAELVVDAFQKFREKPDPLGLMVLTIANLYTLEKLHGSAAVNSAFFVCAERLRRCVPNNIEMGRLGNDGFLFIMRNCSYPDKWMELARSVESRLRRAVALNTNLDATQLETDSTLWVGDIGVGAMVVTDPSLRGSTAVAMSRGMSRTAISYSSRIAWLDAASRAIVELPVHPSGGERERR